MKAGRCVVLPHGVFTRSRAHDEPGGLPPPRRRRSRGLACPGEPAGCYPPDYFPRLAYGGFNRSLSAPEKETLDSGMLSGTDSRILTGLGLVSLYP
ncbi:hypothetical protein GQ53DRAFT_135342 [Thozetella sp. PMI_491]|nr:hypothetical protein GQ53DRAFT_135342 [Thozetella sp. PMI_491]